MSTASTTNVASDTTIVRKKELAAQLGVSPTTLWRMRDQLPRPIQVSKGIEGWTRGDISRWIEERRGAR